MQEFESLCEILDASTDSQFDLRELMSKLASLNPSAYYSEKSLTSKLLEKYKGLIGTHLWRNAKSRSFFSVVWFDEQRHALNVDVRGTEHVVMRLHL